MAVIIDTENFVVDAHDRPHHSRENGGHIVIWPRQEFAHLSDMPNELAAEFMGLSQIVGEAFMNVMRSQGLDVVRVNYACYGNWNYKEPIKDPVTHMSLYLRIANEKHPDGDPRFQAFPEALVFPGRQTGYYDRFVSLSEEDRSKIKDEMLRLAQTEKYASLVF